MSSRYDFATVLTLKDSVSPTLTLISVAKPWIAAVPEPLTSHVLCGVPGFVFSHATELRTAQGSAAAAALVARPATSIAAARTSATRAEVRRPDVHRAMPAAVVLLITGPPRGGCADNRTSANFLRPIEGAFAGRC